MPTTANFSLEYPDDNSSVDIAGHFETLADDVDAAINTRLALTGGTLTGALVGTLTTDSSSSTSGAFKTAGGMGIAKALYVGTTLNVTGATTLTGDLTVSKAAPYLTVNSTSGHAYSLMSRPAGSRAWQYFQTAGSTRWTTGVSADAESGANAGSNYTIAAWNDAGSALSTPLTITRSTGAVTLTGALSVSGNATFAGIVDISSGPLRVIASGAYMQLNANAGGTGVFYFTGAAGASKAFLLQTASSSRWKIGATATAESGSDAGTDFEIYRYSDAGAGLGAALTITRSTGAVTLTGDLTISKASATHTIGSSSGTTNVNLDSVAGTYKYLNFRTGTSVRWTLGTTATAESGSNAGTDLFIGRYTDGGAYIDAVLSITRSTGKTTLGSVGATAGLELGYSGPRVMSGTGSPEGVVTAPVGSQWTDTAATTGAIRWIKATGTGNTGWVVEYGDTGLRNVTTLLENGWTSSYVTLRRVGSLVLLYAPSFSAASATADTFITLPSGFRVAGSYPGIPAIHQTFQGSLMYSHYTTGATTLVTRGTGTHSPASIITWATTDAWPSSLPGSAA